MYKKRVDKLIFIFVIILLLNSILTFADQHISNYNNTKYDKKILEKFSKKIEVPVLVKIRDNSNININKNLTKEENIQILKQRDQWLSIKIDEVISTISNDEFRVEGKGISGFSGFITKKGLEKLSKDPRVKSILLAETGARATLKNSVPLINVEPDVWDLGYNGTGEDVCIIDSGIDIIHTDLTKKITKTYCYCSTADNGKNDCCPNGNSEDTNATDNYGHGTHVAGIIVSQNPTYKGVAPGSNVTVVKVLNSTGDGQEPVFWDDLEKAIAWCRNQGVDIISMSIGDRGNWGESGCGLSSVNDEINLAYNLSIAIVAAAGNEHSTNGINYPACAPNVISVGSSTKSDYMSVFFTNRYSGLDLVAPGGTRTGKKEPCPLDDWICSTKLNGGFIGKSGTSMSAPHVSGAAAILKQFGKEELNRDLSPSEILNALNFTGVPITDTGFSGLTFNRIDVAAAINYLSKINVGDSVNGKIRQNQTWQTNLSINSGKIGMNLTASLDWGNSYGFEFTLKEPNGTEHTTTNINNPVIGISKLTGNQTGNWIIKLKGKNIPQGISKDFTIITKAEPPPAIVDVRAGVEAQ